MAKKYRVFLNDTITWMVDLETEDDEATIRENLLEDRDYYGEDTAYFSGDNVEIESLEVVDG